MSSDLRLITSTGVVCEEVEPYVYICVAVILELCVKIMKITSYMLLVRL
jgi:hypothetical protein